MAWQIYNSFYMKSPETTILNKNRLDIFIDEIFAVTLSFSC